MQDFILDEAFSDVDIVHPQEIQAQSPTPSVMQRELRQEIRSQVEQERNRIRQEVERELRLEMGHQERTPGPPKGADGLRHYQEEPSKFQMSRRAWIFVAIFLFCLIAVGISLAALFLNQDSASSKESAEPSTGGGSQSTDDATEEPPLATIVPTAAPTLDPTGMPTLLPTIPVFEPINQWTQLGGDISGELVDDMFGAQVAVSGDGMTLAASSTEHNVNGPDSGQVRVFQFNAISNSWDQLGQTILGDQILDRLGSSVALSKDGQILAVGAIQYGRSNKIPGLVRVFRYNAGSQRWILVGQEIVGTGPDDAFGYAVSLSDDGSVLAVGSRFGDANGENAGHVNVFLLSSSSGSWEPLGSTILGEAEGDLFGLSVALSSDGSTLAAGGEYNDGNGEDTGHIRVFQLDAATREWMPLGQPLTVEGERFGRSVAISGNGRIVAGGGRGVEDDGLVRIFQYDDVAGLWTPKGQDLLGRSAQSGLFGDSLAMSVDGSIVAVGAHFADNGFVSSSGQVRIFRFVTDENQWVQLGDDINGRATNDFFGISVALSDDGRVLVAGSTGSDNDGLEDSGRVAVYQGIG